MNYNNYRDLINCYYGCDPILNAYNIHIVSDLSYGDLIYILGKFILSASFDYQRYKIYDWHEIEINKLKTSIEIYKYLSFKNYHE